MNTNDDLIRQIGEVVDEKIAARLEPIHQRLEVLEKGQRSQGRAIKKVQKTLNASTRLFDSEDVRLHKRVQRIETHLGLP